MSKQLCLGLLKEFVYILNIRLHLLVNPLNVFVDSVLAEVRTHLESFIFCIKLTLHLTSVYSFWGCVDVML